MIGLSIDRERLANAHKRLCMRMCMRLMLAPAGDRLDRLRHN